jgi:hypothetical protein
VFHSLAVQDEVGYLQLDDVHVVALDPAGQSCIIGSGEQLARPRIAPVQSVKSTVAGSPNLRYSMALFCRGAAFRVMQSFCRAARIIRSAVRNIDD